MFGGDFRSRVPDGHASPDLGRGVGHAADDFAVLEKPGQNTARGTGDDRHDELLRPKLAAQLVTDLGQRLWLDR